MSTPFSLLRATAAAAGPGLTPVADAVIPALGSQFQLPRRLLLIGAGARVLAMRHIQADVVAARLVFAGQTLRPGAFAFALGTDEAPTLPRPETSGVMGVFDAVAPPSLELYQPGGAATTTGAGFLLLQRIAERGTPGWSSAKPGGCGCGGGR